MKVLINQNGIIADLQHKLEQTVQISQEMQSFLNQFVKNTKSCYNIINIIKEKRYVRKFC